MTHAAHPADPGPGGPRSARALAALGGTLFAGVLMLLLGVLGILQGVATLASGSGVIGTNPGGFAFSAGPTLRGWVHLLLGALLLATSWGVLTGTRWGRALGSTLTALMIVAQFLWLPYQPFFALVNITVGIFAEWALYTRRPAADINRPDDPAPSAPTSPPAPTAA